MRLPRPQWLRRYRWRDIPRNRKYAAYAGGSVVLITGILEHKFQECVEVVGNPANLTSVHTIFWLRLLYGRTRSRFLGSLFEMTLPVKLREPIYHAYAWKYGANLDEVRYPLDSFQTFNEFFGRALNDGLRPITDLPDGLVSPVDGRLMTCGTLTCAGERIAQVKGATYSVPSFLGLDPVDVDTEEDSPSAVHYAVIYLGPGDYHRIHSPAELEFKSGRHFCGELFPLRESFLNRVDDVFCVNERVVLTGTWRFGQMHLAAVAAAHVGSIYLDFDPRLKTNRMRDIVVHCGGDISSKLYPSGVSLKAGDPVGGFHLGSTVVLFFDAPRNFQWKVGIGETTRVGKPLGAAS